MEEGKQIGDWKCLKLLGRGHFGVVGLWKNLKTKQTNAIKKFEVRSSAPPGDKVLLEMQKRWKKEVDLMYTLIDCSFIVSTAAVPQDLAASIPASAANLPLLCLEYCCGGDLRQMLRRPANMCGLKQKDILTILDHVSQAITYLHDKNIIHRDIKPDNILVQYDSSNKVTYKLSDLGFAKDLTNSQSLCSTQVGTVQYLAPEIYMGKVYDKTVDYWSFGVIAFEIMCGMRPFLHGESPTNWLPLVEEKPKDVIAIYRTDEGRIEFSNDMPFNTRCSDTLKKCLVTWLKTMLQVDPSTRGKKISEVVSSSNGNSPTPFSPLIAGLVMLKKTIATKFIQIHTPNKMLEFAVGTHTTIAEVQQWISKEVSLLPENQLIITIDGVEIQKTDLAAKYSEQSVDLFLIPKSDCTLKLKLKMPKNVNTFLTQKDNMKEPLTIARVWSNAIYFVQTEMEKIDTVKKTSEALKCWCTSNYTNQLKAYRNEIEKSAASLGTVLELESKLEEIDAYYSKEKSNSDEVAGVQIWTQEMVTLQNFYSTCLDDWVENVVLKPVTTTILEETYDSILKSCEAWKSSESNSSTSKYNDILVRHVCQFLVEREQIGDALLHNISKQLEKVRSDAKLINEMQAVITKLNHLISEIKQSRCAKQVKQLQKLHGGDPFPNNPVFTSGNNGIGILSNKENTPLYATLLPKNVNNHATPSTVYECVSNQPNSNMSKILSQSVVVSQVNKNLTKPKEMTQSLHSSMSRSPPINKLMEESQLLKSQAETTIQSLRDSVEEMNKLMKEKSKCKWELLT